MGLEHHLEGAGLQAIPDPDDRQCLACSLVYPTRRHLGRAGNSHLQTRGISQVDDVILQTETFAPAWFTAGTLIEVTLLRMDDAGVALRQFLKTGPAKTLVKTLAGLPAAVHTINAAAEFQFQLLSQQGVYRNLGVSQGNFVGDWPLQPAAHLS